MADQYIIPANAAEKELLAFTLWIGYTCGMMTALTWHEFLNLCRHPHEAICTAAQISHARLYDVAAGAAAPFDDEVEYVFPSR